MALGLTVGLGSVLLAARVLRAVEPGVTVIPTGNGRLPTLPVIMKSDQQEMELEKQYAGKIPDVFDNLDGLGQA